MINKISYWIDKIPEFKHNLEPLTLLMIRTTGEAHFFAEKNKTTRTKIINTKDINILHSIDRDSALKKFEKRKRFLEDNKETINNIIQEDKYLSLSSKFFHDSPFDSINEEVMAQINYNGNHTKYITISGVSRIAALQSVFKNGINIKLNVITINYKLQRRLVSINNLYIYGDRFNNLKKYDVIVNEIVYKNKNKNKTKKYSRNNYLKTMKTKIIDAFIPYKG